MQLLHLVKGADCDAHVKCVYFALPDVQLLHLVNGADGDARVRGERKTIAIFFCVERAHVFHFLPSKKSRFKLAVMKMFRTQTMAILHTRAEGETLCVWRE